MTENGNFEFHRDDSIRSSLSKSSRPGLERNSKNSKNSVLNGNGLNRKGPKRPPQPSLSAVAQNSVYRQSMVRPTLSPNMKVRTLPNGSQSEVRPGYQSTSTGSSLQVYSLLLNPLARAATQPYRKAASRSSPSYKTCLNLFTLGNKVGSKSISLESKISNFDIFK